MTAMTRREVLGVLSGALTVAALPAGPAPPERRRPMLRGTLWWYDPGISGAMGLDGWRKELAEQKAIGFDLLWLLNAHAGLPEAGGLLRDLIALCERRGFSLLVSVAMTPMWYERLDLDEEKQAVQQSVKELAPLLRDTPAFFGWYLPQEIYFWTGPAHTYIRDLYRFSADACRRAIPGKPVALSPFFILDRTKTFGDFYVPSPSEYGGYWAQLIRDASLDIIMLQDSGEHFSWVTNSQRRPYFAAMKQACDAAGARLWGNVECAEMHFESLREYIRVNGRVHHVAAREKRWRPVPLQRLISKIELAASWCEDLVTWGYQEFCRPASGPAGLRWYDDYRRYVRRAPSGAY
ncbi:MAG: DUF4434 domain-containing protein [Armatimonadota bacterium]